MTEMTLHPDFIIRCRAGAVRVRFAFGVSGTERAGTLYINANVAPGADLVAEARKHARLVAKRAAADAVELYSVSNPTR